MLRILLLAFVAVSALAQTAPVRVDLFVMSKCPDAEVCEDMYDGVVAEVGSIIDLHVNYIASINASTETGFTCMHGQSEVISYLITERIEDYLSC